MSRRGCRQVSGIALEYQLQCPGRSMTQKDSMKAQGGSYALNLKTL